MCFLKSIQICLQRDFNEHYTLTELKDKIVDELVEHFMLIFTMTLAKAN